MSRFVFLAAGIFLISTKPATAGYAPVGYTAHQNLNYGDEHVERHKLDIYLPETKSDQPFPVLIYIHGGGWEGGSKGDVALLFPLLSDRDTAFVSLNYRLTNTASWPAQIEDVKRAMKWLADHADEYRIDMKRAALLGISAGGHLVSLLGTTHGVEELEKGAQPQPKPLCVINFCGPENFPALVNQKTDINVEDPRSAVGKLLGGKLSERLEIARQASPITYVDSTDGPFLHIYGTADNLVPYAQATEFDKVLDAAGVKSCLLTGEGGPHVFGSAKLFGEMRAFLRHFLFGEDFDFTDRTVPVK